MKPFAISLSAVWIFIFCLNGPSVARVQSDTPAYGINPLVSDQMFAKEIDIFLEKKTKKKKAVPDKKMKLEKKMPEKKPEPEPELDDFEDPFAEKEEDISEEKEDKHEGFNRAMHDVNDTIYQYFFKPLAKGYEAIMPEEGRVAVGNAFDNLKAPQKLVSSAIQGDADKSGRSVSRFLINSTLGFGGLLDVAGQEYGIENVNEDFSQALASQGVGSGDYIVLPVFGPSTTRDAVGRVVDNLLNPINYTGVGFLANTAINTTEQVNTTSFHYKDIDDLNENAIDPYESQRHFYLELREKQTKE